MSIVFLLHPWICLIATSCKGDVYIAKSVKAGGLFVLSFKYKVCFYSFVWDLIYLPTHYSGFLWVEIGIVKILTILLDTFFFFFKCLHVTDFCYAFRQIACVSALPCETLGAIVATSIYSIDKWSVTTLLNIYFSLPSIRAGSEWVSASEHELPHAPPLARTERERSLSLSVIVKMHHRWRS